MDSDLGSYFRRETLTTIGLDCETTGLDIYHGTAQPFLVTICEEGKDPDVWEWEVDPYSREVLAPREELKEIRDVIEGCKTLVIQNAIFDISVLLFFLKKRGVKLRVDWTKVIDTLYAGHLLGSNYRNDLTSLLLRYLSVDISPYEEKLEKVVKAARNEVNKKEFKTRHGEIRKASEGLTDLPSLSQFWRADYWLPRAVATLEKYPEDHPWRNTLSDYASVDSSVLVPLWRVQEELIESRGLRKIYDSRLKLLPIVYEMEYNGVTVSGESLDRSLEEFRGVSESSGRICTNIALSYNYDLSLPKSGNNKSLLNFAFGEETVTCKDCGETLKPEDPYCSCGGVGKYKRKPYLDLPPIKFSDKTGKPSLDKYVLEEYSVTLPTRSKALLFVKKLVGKRKCDTSISYLEGFYRFRRELPGVRNWYLLHPNLNVTGTDTLRWSSSNPNSQNISKQEDYNLRTVFGPPPGFVWFAFDYSNLELTIPAYESEEESIISLLERPNDPPYFGSFHLLVFDTLHPTKWNRDDPEGLLKAKKKYASTWYQWTKNGNFAVQYGAMEESGTADKAYHVSGGQKRIKKRLGKMEQHNQRMIRFAERNGYVETIPDKTVDPDHGYPLLCTRTKWGRIKPTIPLNYRTQGTAMWVTSKAMVRVREYLSRLRECRIILQVHDELVIQVPESLDNKKEVTDEIQNLMAKSGDDIGIPLRVGCSYFPNNWGEEEKYEP